MTSRSLTRVIAVGAAACLTLSACSNNDDAEQEDHATSSASTSSSSESNTDETKSTEDSTEPDEAKDPEGHGNNPAKDSKDPAGNQAQPGSPADSPAQDNNPAGAPPPVSTDGTDEEQIRRIVLGIKSNTDDPHQYMRYLRANACRSYIDQAGGREGFDQLADGIASTKQDVLPKINKVNSVTVNGDSASADIDATVQDVPQTEPMKFVREDGRWKICA